jgi:predicted nuclease of restriction endonuclease-like (RecB) superfamily
LFDRVVGILEQARAGVVRAVNSHMVLAYWLIGREIVQEIQGGKGRAAYGGQALEDLSRKLTARYGEGFSKTSLKYFRTFYLAYADRLTQKGRTTGDLFAAPPSLTPKGRTPCDLLNASVPTSAIQHTMGAESLLPSPICYPAGSESLAGFSPQLSWSHYRALMRVEKVEAREFYEREATDGTWDVRTLERQIHSFYYERLLKSQHPQKMLADGRQTLTATEPAIESLKNPYVLEFLGLPEVAALQESDLEAAILSYLQAFLLELGKGFAFVARQKRLRFEEDDRYVDLVFYHCQLKFYLLIDLKIGELTHGDVGQMDGYVRMFDDLVATEGDNPTIGLILCTEKNETVAKYSVLKDRKQIFASKYMLYLPTEEELRREIERERRLIEDRAEAASDKTKRNRKA